MAVSQDMARTWSQHHNLPLALYYHVSVDNDTPYNVCGGLQDNYNWCGPSAVRFSRGIKNSDWYQVQGGDGFVVLQDPRDSRVRVQRVAGRQHPAPQPRHRRGAQHPAELRERRPAWPRARSRSAGTGTRRWCSRSTSPARCSWPPTGCSARTIAATRGRSSAPISRPTPIATRCEIMGARGNQVTLSRNDGISNWPTIVSLAESPKHARRLLHRHGRRRGEHVEGRRQDVGTHHGSAAGLPEVGLRLRSRAVEVRRATRCT